MNSSAAQLLKDGYVILPSAYPGDLRRDLEAEFMRMPEFRQHPSFAILSKTVRYGCGATSFLGSPSVFHNAASRLHRMETHKRFLPLFASMVGLLGRPDLLLNVLIDRIQVRPPGESPQKESWHRDVMPSSRSGEFCIGAQHDANDCESVQFVSGIAPSWAPAPQASTELLLSYGINDCEAKVARIPIAQVWGMLRPLDGEVGVCE